MPKLDSWKEIAAYLDCVPRTAQRWHKNEKMPVHREAGGNINRVFAWTHEIDEWRYGGGNQEDGNHEKGELPRVKKNENPPKGYLKFLVIILFGVLILSLWIFFQKNTGNLLHHKVFSRSPGSVIEIYNKQNNLVLQLLEPSADYSQSGPPIPTLWIGDLNGDSLDDVAFMNRYDAIISIFEQNSLGNLKKKHSWNVPNSYRYQGREFNEFDSFWIKCADLTGDGKPEVITLSREIDFYPSSCHVFDQKGLLLFEIWHPGRLENSLIADRDGDGTMELILSGTNNFISEGESSTPITLVIQREWSQVGALDLFGKNRTLISKVPEDTQLWYINLKKDHLVKETGVWQGAKIQFHLEKSLRIHTSKLSSGGHLRSFLLDSQNACYEAYTSETLVDFGVEFSDYLEAGLLTPLYWNGKLWQEEVCWVPNTKKLSEANR